jgi:hypothetical protein
MRGRLPDRPARGVQGEADSPGFEIFGTGFVITPNIVITNAHVIRNLFLFAQKKNGHAGLHPLLEVRDSEIALHSILRNV